MKEELKNRIQFYLSGVDSQNFSKKYDGLTQIVIDSNTMLMKDDILYVLKSIVLNDDLNEWQEEIVGEIIARIYGQCTPGKVIALK